MIFKNLKEKCEFYRSREDIKLIPNGYVLMMLDGRSFSKLIKNHYKKPFDEKFIWMMNEVAKHLCQNISGAKFAYVQSDEISIFIKDTNESDPFMKGRICKLLSVPAAMAASKFNQLVIADLVRKASDVEEAARLVEKLKLAEFDCKVWNVPNPNEVYAWFLYRQLDCIRNSKQQTAQTWLPHDTLRNKEADEQVQMLKEFNGEDWETYPEGQKYGRFVHRVETQVAVPEKWKAKMGEDCTRHVWDAEPMVFLATKDDTLKAKYRDYLISIIEGGEVK